MKRFPGRLYQLSAIPAGIIMQRKNIHICDFALYRVKHSRNQTITRYLNTWAQKKNLMETHTFAP